MAATVGFSRDGGGPLPPDGRGSVTIDGGSINNAVGGNGRSFGSSLGGSVVASAPQHSDVWPDEELLTCCLCSGRLVDPLLLDCMHSCCRRCADSNSAATSIRCPRCDYLTDERCVKPNAFLACCLAADAGCDDTGGYGGETPPCDACSLINDVAPAPAVAGERSAASAVTLSPSSYWCADCNKFLCDGCIRWHDKFNADHAVVSPSAAGTTEAVAAAFWPLCAEHGRPLDLLCIDCSGLRCKGGCCRSCIDRRHRLRPASGRRSSKKIGKLLMSLRHSLRSLACLEAAICRHKRQPAVLVRSRGLDLSRLQANKKQALDAIAEAHYAAGIEAMAKREATFGASARKTSLSERDGGSPRVGGAEAASSLELVRRRVKHAAAYVERLLQQSDALDALDQLPIVEAQMLALEEQTRQLVSVAGPLHPAVPSAQQSDQLKSELCDALRRWIGRPNQSQHQDQDQVSSPGNAGDHLPGNEVSHRLPTTPVPSAHSALPQTSGDASGLLAGCHPPPATTKKEGADLSQPQQQPLADNSCDDESLPPKVLVFGDAVDSFRIPYDCRDVAVTSDGRVLLAALRHGLKHYTAEGRKLPSWQPSHSSGIMLGQTGIVSTVDALNDGRVLVGVIDFQCVFLLRSQRRPGSVGFSDVGREGSIGGIIELIELDRVDLHVAPYRLAACGGLSGYLLAVVGASSKERSKSGGGGLVVGSTWSPGPQLCLYSLAAATGKAGTASNERLQQRQLLLDLQLDYDALSVAVTSHAVVTVSNGRVSPSAGHGGSSAFVVEARACGIDKSGNIGDLLWQRAVHEDMYDLFFEPKLSGRGRVLYAVLPRSVRVTALCADDGRTLNDAVVSRSRHAIISPLRASMAACWDISCVDASQSPLVRLVVLAAGRTVIVYPSTGRNG